MRTAAIAIGVVGLLLVGAALFLSTRLDAYLDENRAWLEEQAEAALGREVRFGDLGVSFRGGLGARVSDLRVGEDPAYGEGDFLALDEAVVRVALWPALFGRYEISSVLLRSPRIQVIQGPDGLSTDSLASGDPQAAEPDESESDPAAALLVALLDIEDGVLRYVDRTGPEPVPFEIEDLDVEASDLRLDGPIEFTLSARVLGAAAPNLEGSGRAGPLAAEEAPVDVSLRLSPLPLAALARLPAVASSLPEGSRIEGPLDVAVRVRGTVAALDLEADVDAGAAELHVPDTLDKPAGVPLDYTLKGRLAGEAFELREGALRLAEAVLATRGELSLAPAGGYRLDLSADAAPLAGWDRILPALAGLGLEGRLGLELALRGPPADEGLPAIDGHVALEDVALRLPEQPPVESLRSRIELADGGAVVEDSSLQLGGSLVRFSGRIADLERPVLRFAAESPALQGASIGLEEPGSDGGDVLRDVRLEGTATPAEAGLTADARLTSGSGQLSGIPYESLTGVLHLDAETAELRDVAMQTLGGRVGLRASYELAATETPGWTMALELAGLDARRLAVSQLGSAGELVEGRLDSTLDLRGRGLDYATIAQALTGSGRVALSDGVLKKVNVGEAVLQKLTGVPGLTQLLSPSVRERHPRLFTEGATAFDALRSRLDIRDGRIYSEQLQLVAKDFGLAGGGSVGLSGDVDLTTTFTASPELSRSLTGGGRTQQLLARDDGRIAIPVSVGGSLDGLSVQPDLRFVQQALAEGARRAVSDQAQGLLQDLLGGGRRRSGGSEPPAAGTDPGSGPEPSSEAAAGGGAETPGEPDGGPPEEPETEEPRRAPTAREAVERGLGELLGR